MFATHVGVISVIHDITEYRRRFVFGMDGSEAGCVGGWDCGRLGRRWGVCWICVWCVWLRMGVWKEIGRCKLREG